MNGEGLLNFIVATPAPLFHSAVMTEKEREDHCYIAGKMIEVIDDVGPDKCRLLNTDNAKAMRLAWEKVRQIYPHIATIRMCSSWA